MQLSRLCGLGLLSSLAFIGGAEAQRAAVTKASKQPDEVQLVKSILESRSKYQENLERLYAHYRAAGELEKARWAEEELRQFHRIGKQAYLLQLDVPPPTLKPTENIPEANDLYLRAMGYKDKGWSNDYIDNQRRAELLLQQLLTNYPQSDKIGDAAFQLGDIYESRAYRQYRRAAMYYERSTEWSPTGYREARIRAARIYDRNLVDRNHARELYRAVTTHDTDPARIEEAKKRLAELSSR
jgi:hypothetical protein